MRKTYIQETKTVIEKFNNIKEIFTRGFMQSQTEYFDNSLSDGGFATAHIESEAQQFILTYVEKVEKEIKEIKNNICLNPCGKVDLTIIAQERMNIKRKDKTKKELQDKIKELQQMAEKLN